MKKETVMAIFFGILFGAIVAIFLIIKNNEFKFDKTKTIAPSAAVNQKAKTTPMITDLLEIQEPQDNTIFSTKNIRIKGTVEKNSLIVIQSPIQEVSFTTGQKEFSVPFSLAMGENVINITAYSKESRVRPQEKELHIFFLENEL